MDYSNEQYAQTFQQPQPSEQLSQPPIQNQNQNQNQKKNNKNKFLNSMYNFFNSSTGTILSFSAGICIGGAFKDLVQNLVTSVIKPLIIKLLIITKIYDIAIVSSVIKEDTSILSVTSALSSIVSFIVIFITVYLIFDLIHN